MTWECEWVPLSVDHVMKETTERDLWLVWRRQIKRQVWLEVRLFGEKSERV